jgi:hypothetical protein
MQAFQSGQLAITKQYGPVPVIVDGCHSDRLVVQIALPRNTEHAFLGLFQHPRSSQVAGDVHLGADAKPPALHTDMQTPVFKTISEFACGSYADFLTLVPMHS